LKYQEEILFLPINRYLYSLSILLYFSKKSKDDNLFLLLVKSIIVIVETYYLTKNINEYLPNILHILIREIKNTEIVSLKCFLLQGVKLLKSFNYILIYIIQFNNRFVYVLYMIPSLL